MSTVDGYVWDDDEWMRRIEQAEDGAATASAVMALYDSLMSHDDVPSRGVGCLMGRQYRLARLASLPSAPASMLMDMAAVLVDGAGSKGFDDLAFPVVYALGDNPALQCAAYDGLERAYGGDGGVCPELGCVTPCTRTVWLGARSWATQLAVWLTFRRGLCRLCVRVS